ncbi:acetylcholinesterase-like [Ixodes scapularis]
MKGQRSAHLLLLSCMALTAAAHAGDDGEGPVVHTTAGCVRGFRQQLNGKVVNSFTGIRYGKAPVGALRFREPHPAEPWTDVADATRPAPVCIQVNIQQSGLSREQDSRAQTEDCLFLNVWSPARNNSVSDLAVMVWIHGGALHSGSSSSSIYDGAFLAAYGDVVVVSMNYRLGSLGFLYQDSLFAPGNQGHLDQSLALHWRPWYGMTHVDDVLYVFGRPVVEKASFEDQTYSKKLMGLWTSFAKHGKTHLVEAYQWPQLVPGNLAAMKITNRPPEQTVLNLGERCRFWSRLFLHYNQSALS